ncbi:MAG: hypothetical protein AB1431_12650 [Pseudomonadota bacterium]
MSLDLCISELSSQGKLGSRQRERAEQAFDRHYRRLSNEMSPEAAAAEASAIALQEIEAEIHLRKKQTFLQAQAQQRMSADMARYQGNVLDAAKALLGSDAKAPFMSVEAQEKAILGRAHARMEQALSRFSRDLRGETRNKADLADVVREMFGENSGNDAAKSIATAWKETAEMLRQRFNRAGGSIGKRDDWGAPQSHDMMKVRGAGFRNWRDFILPKLDLERMIDDSTGLPFTVESLDAALSDVFASISTDGWNKRTPGQISGFPKRANRRSDPRFLVFKKAEDWAIYQERFGNGDAFQAMMGYLEGMSRDIALMERLGPNPTASVRWLQDMVKQTAALTDGADAATLDKARSSDKAIAELYDVVSGQLNSPVNETWARRMGGVRSFLTSAMLGSAQLSAITDVGFQATTRAFNGLPITGAMTDYLKLLNPAASEDRKLAVTLGLVAEEASKRAASLGRYTGDAITPGIAGRLADGILRASGLSAWTQAGKWGFGMSALAHLAHVRGKSWDALDPALRGMMQRYGIEETGWNAIRSTEPYRYQGGEWLRPDDVKNEALGDAMLRMILTETDYAVPSVTARSRAIMNFGQRPGTLGGEIIRNGVMFKSFGVSLLLTHGARMMSLGGWNRAQYAAGLIVTTTLLGGLAMQLKEIAKGKTPQDMKSEEFWARAALQGGGLGIFGDFIASTENRFGGGLAETIGGPVVSAISDVQGVAWRGLTAATDEEKDFNAGKEATRLLSRYTPGSSLWYARTAFNRMVLDQLQREADPDYDESWARMERAAEDAGQEFWWAPGELAPQ